MKPTAPESRLGGIRIFEVAFHDDVAAHHNLPERIAVSRHVAHLIVHHAQAGAAQRMSDTLLRLDLRPFHQLFPIPLLAPLAMSEGAVSFCEAVDVSNVNADLLGVAD